MPSFDHGSSHNKSNEKLYITASQRINLGRPINFNPGPGAYLKETINSVHTTKGKLTSSMHSEASIGSGLKRKVRDRFMLESIEINRKSRDQ